MFELSPAHSFITTIKYRACNIGIIHAIFAIYSAIGEADINHIFGVKIREYLKITTIAGVLITIKLIWENQTSPIFSTRINKKPGHLCNRVLDIIYST